MTRDRVIGWSIAAVLGVLVGLLVWQALDNISLGGAVVIAAVIAAAAWDRAKGGR